MSCILCVCVCARARASVSGCECLLEEARLVIYLYISALEHACGFVRRYRFVRMNVDGAADAFQLGIVLKPWPRVDVYQFCPGMPTFAMNGFHLLSMSACLFSKSFRAMSILLGYVPAYII